MEDTKWPAVCLLKAKFKGIPRENTDLTDLDLQREITIDIKMDIDKIDRHFIMSLGDLIPLARLLIS